MDLTLIGGGWDAALASALYGEFVAAVVERAESAPADIACVVLDEGDGQQQAERWMTVLRTFDGVAPRAVLVPLGATLAIEQVAAAGGVLVCGGLTPAYADALRPVAAALRALVAGGLPYAGFSAGTAIAARRALVGGWRVDGVPVCDEDAGEDLDEVTVVDGLGLVDWPLDVHAAQWGTVPRLEAVVRRDHVSVGYAVDENTAIRVTPAGAVVIGSGAVHRVASEGTTQLRAGDRVA